MDKSLLGNIILGRAIADRGSPRLTTQGKIILIRKIGPRKSTPCLGLCMWVPRTPLRLKCPPECSRRYTGSGGKIAQAADKMQAFRVSDTLT